MTVRTAKLILPGGIRWLRILRNESCRRVRCSVWFGVHLLAEAFRTADILDGLGDVTEEFLRGRMMLMKLLDQYEAVCRSKDWTCRCDRWRGLSRFGVASVRGRND